jgi:ankyrin repeat protein
VKNNCDSTPLHVALENEQFEMAELLMEQGASLVIENNEGNTALHLASKIGKPELISNMVVNVKNSKSMKPSKFVNKKNKSGCSSLHLAVIGNHMEAVQGLIDHGADIRARNDAGDDVMLLSAKNGNVDMVRIFSAKGSSIQVMNLGDYTRPLHQASGAGHLALVQHLLSQGASLEFGDIEGNTALHHAATNGNLEIVDELLSRGALIDSKNKSDETALHLATKENHLTTVEHLIEKGANI